MLWSGCGNGIKLRKYKGYGKDAIVRMQRGGKALCILDYAGINFLNETEEY